MVMIMINDYCYHEDSNDDTDNGDHWNNIDRTTSSLRLSVSSFPFSSFIDNRVTRCRHEHKW